MGRFTKGLVKDTGVADQPPGTWRFARNVIVNKIDGAVSNEGGNKSIRQIGRKSDVRTVVDGYTVIGAIEITDDRVVLFSVNEYIIKNPSTGEETPHEDFGRSEIGVYQSGSYTAILNLKLDNPLVAVDVDLKFNSKYPIHGTYKIDAKENLFVYFRDDINPPRCLNITRQSNNSGSIYNKYENLYNVSPEESPNKNYIDRLNLFPHSGPVPNIEFKSINSGGGLTTAVYQLALAYVDVDLVATNYLVVDNPVSIVDDLESVLPIERYDGASPGSQTGKSLTWSVTNLNTDYEYIRPAIIQTVGGKRFAYRLNDLEINPNGDPLTQEITFTGAEGYQQQSVEDVVVDYVQYDKVKTLEQLDGVLYAGNLEGTLDVGFQKHAGNIVLKPKTKVLENFEPLEVSTDNISDGYLETLPPNESRLGSYRDVNNAYKYKGYLRNEVYAFYIAFILNDGRMSYAYHIPGRKSISNELETNKITQDLKDLSTNAKNFHFVEYSNEDGSKDMNYWQNANEVYPNTEDYNNLSFKNDDGSMSKVRHHHFPSNSNSEYSFWDGTASDITTVPGEFINLSWNVERGAGAVEYHSSGLNNHDWGGITIPSQSIGSSFTGDNWTAFKINDLATAVPEIGTIYDITWYLNQVGDFTNNSVEREFTGKLLAQDGNWFLFDRQGGNAPDFLNSENRFRGATISYSAQMPDQATGTALGKVKILGFELENIEIPKDIADKVQGFRIYHSKRKHEYKTILGQGIVAPYIKLKTQIGGCISEPEAGNNNEEDLFVKYPLNTDTKFNSIDDVDFGTLSFYNFELLRKKDSIGAATHITRVGSSSYLTWLGAGELHLQAEEGQICNDNSTIRSTFGVLDDYTTFNQEFTSNDVIENTHFPIRERCKSYVKGDSIFDARGLGFGLKLYNRGGDSHIALGLTKDLDYKIYGSDSESISEWNTSGFPFQYLADVNLSTYNVNLAAFKEDTYNALDTQDLVWTGFQVVGESLNNFISDSAEATFNTVNLGDEGKDHEGIFGGDTFICRYGIRQSLYPRLTEDEGIDRVSGLYTVIESNDNICFRHEEDVSSSFYPGSPGKKFLFVDRAGKSDSRDNLLDYTSQENIKYNGDYSVLNELATAFPLPLLVSQPTNFPTRIHRSVKSDPGSLIDNFRIFLALQYKDLPKNRGSISNLTSFNNLLYIHTEDSLFKTKGKQSMRLGDGSEAFVGSGDIFVQEPDELVQTEAGYGGTRSQSSCNVSKYGYFSVDQRNSRVYLTTNQMNAISGVGMEKWFQENMSFKNLGLYGYVHTEDSPITGLGFTSVWDYMNQRILLTKRDLIPTRDFRERFNAGRPTTDPLYKPLLNQDVFTQNNGTVLNITDLNFSTLSTINPRTGPKSIIDANTDLVYYIVTDRENTITATSSSTSGVTFKTTTSSGIAAIAVAIPEGFNGLEDSELVNYIFNIFGTASTAGVSCFAKLTSEYLPGMDASEVMGLPSLSPIDNSLGDVPQNVAFTPEFNKDNVFYIIFILMNMPVDTSTVFTLQTFEILKEGELAYEGDIQNGSIVYDKDDNNFKLRTIQPKSNLIYLGDFINTDNTFLTQSENTQGVWKTGAGWSIAEGKASCSTGSNLLQTDYIKEITLGAIYNVTFNVPNYTSGGLSVSLGEGGTTKSYANFNANEGQYIAELEAVGEITKQVLTFQSNSFVGDISNITVKIVDVLNTSTTESVSNNFEVSNAVIPIRHDTFIDNKEQFKRTGWTISYYPETKFWGSFHDYLPSLYTYDSRYIYSFNSDIADEIEFNYSDVIEITSIEEINFNAALTAFGGNSSAYNTSSTVTYTSSSHFNYIYNTESDGTGRLFAAQLNTLADINTTSNYKITGQLLINTTPSDITLDAEYLSGPLLKLYFGGEFNYDSLVVHTFTGQNHIMSLNTLETDEEFNNFGKFEIITSDIQGALKLINTQTTFGPITTINATILDFSIQEFIPEDITYKAGDIWRHDEFSTPGDFYNILHPFEVEFIDNTQRNESKLHSSFGYETEVFLNDSKIFNNGFTSFIAFNSTQSSGQSDITYFKNSKKGAAVRKVENEWKINDFRDMSSESLLASSNTLIYPQSINIFKVDGMYEPVNLLFTDSDKPWHKQKKFIDTYIGIRLVGDNSDKNLVNLYSTSVAMRKYNR